MDLPTQLSSSCDVGSKVARVYQKRVSLANEQFSERVQKAWHGALTEPQASLAAGWSAYATDFVLRSVLFWDALRQRGNQYLELAQQGQPPVLHFQYETVLDARSFEPVITAAKKGATALGVEFNPDMVEHARKRAAAAGVADKATFVQGDLFEADLSKATVITLFLLPDINRRLRPKILDLAPGTRVASNTFDMGDWEPDAKETSTDCTQWCTALYWVVPAKVGGTWSLGGQTLTLQQKYQVVTGTLGSTPINGKLVGNDITFVAGTRTYAGKVNGTTISGTNWSATRKQAAAASR
jgi:hypothetical protein